VEIKIITNLKGCKIKIIDKRVDIMEADNLWEKSYRNTMQLWGSNPEPKLMQYLNL